MTGESPLVSVLMPVFNAADFLQEAIESILAQSFDNFEFIIIDDGSTDTSRNIINQFDDRRIRLVFLNDNQGIVAVLNLGLALAKGKYLARMDADDVAFSTRLEKQVNFLEKHSETGCLGTNFQWLGKPSEKSWVQYHDSENIRISLLFGCELCHPTVMFRMEEIRSYGLTYPECYPYAEDYGLWVKLSRYIKVANLSEPLLYYRQHDKQISRAKSTLQCKSINSIQLEQLYRFGLQSVSEADLMAHHVLGGAFIPFFQMEWILNNWARKLFEANLTTQLLSDELLRKQVNQRISVVVSKSKEHMNDMSLLRKLHWQTLSTCRFFAAKKAFVFNADQVVLSSAG